MRNIVNIDYTDIDCDGAFNSAIDGNELMLCIRPLATQLTNYKVEITDTKGVVHVSDVIVPSGGLDGKMVEYIAPIAYWNVAGTMKVRLLSSEGNSGYATFTCITINPSDDVCCKYNGNNMFMFHLCGEDAQMKVINNLTSTSTTDALSANMGRVLNERKSNRYATTITNGNGQSGYIQFCRIQITGAYVDIPIMFTLFQRTMIKPSNVYIRFENNDTVDVKCTSFIYDGADIIVYCARLGVGIFSLYVRKTSTWDNLCVFDYVTHLDYMENVKITYLKEFVMSIPNGSLQASYNSK